MLKKRILVIAPQYNFFVKDQVDELSKSVENINILIKYNPLTEISKYIPHKHANYFKKYTKKKLINNINKPSNLKVHLIPTVYFKTDGNNEKLGDMLFKKFDKYIQKNNLKFDLIHAHFTYPYGHAASKLGIKYNVPIVVTAHGYDIYDLPFRDPYWKSTISQTLNSASQIITVGKKNTESIDKLGIKTPVSVIPNGYNPKKFYPRNSEECRKLLDLPKKSKILLSVGNLEPVKGHAHLIKSISKVLEKRKDILCVIVGDGKLKNELQKQIDTLNLNNNVKLVGAKPHEEIPIWMNAADLFVLPSLNEGNPTVLVEALSTGLPFIGTNVGGIPEIINSDEYGLLCEPKNPENLAENILIALEKDWDNEKIINYSKEFTWENISKEILNAYKKVLK
ncbi:glycosyl transferase group 1 [Methanococcus vannielii SB]|uniref:Glycosyl transferase group 1 n=1 Tax=Methanococcus vannielii (strain ATCC 35089 / DSM 1224 / JCM 13029 / OCM 148 / SB) TaxID=406327 RepID=A6UNN7_METVS|nr:glycosyltransferase family 4 protein [Methanococcus vannielii]ABR54109.1 glycosyl transferase group 1 [Methanococcus vannielii SB]